MEGFVQRPEYPNGTYAYFATVDANWNSAYPYIVGPTFFGNVEGQSVNTINETVTTYDGSTSNQENSIEEMKFSVYPNPSQDFLAIQATGLVKNQLLLKLYDLKGRLVRSSTIQQGSTLWYIDIQTLYNGQYILQIENGNSSIQQSIDIAR